MTRKNLKSELSEKQKTNFYKTFLLLALPMALQNMLTTGVNLIDNIMIGQLGDVPIASVGLANKIFFLFSLSAFFSAPFFNTYFFAFCTPFFNCNRYRIIIISYSVFTFLYKPSFFLDLLLLPQIYRWPLLILERIYTVLCTARNMDS